MSLRVLEPVPGGEFKGAGTSAPATDVGGAPLPTELEIARGDVIGVDTAPGGAVARENVSPENPEVAVWGPALAEGEIRRGEKEFGGGIIFLDAEVELTPIVTSVSPAAGSTAGGQTVTITGKYLDSAVNVVLGSHPATTFSVDLSGERITATTPASAAGTVDVHISNQHSTSETVAADRYTFVAPPSTPPGGPGAGGGGGSPTVTGFKQSSSRWRLGTKLPHISSAPTGTTFAFTLGSAANVSLTFMHVLPGRRVGGSCVARSRRNGSKPRCKRYVQAGGLAVPGHAGLEKISFQGRLSRTRRLGAGDYTATVTLAGSHGPVALARPLSFTILP